MLVQSSIIKIEVWAWRYREVLVPSSIKAIVEAYSILLHLLSLIIATGQHVRSKKILFCLHLFSSTYYSSSTFVFWGEREKVFLVEWGASNKTHSTLPTFGPGPSISKVQFSCAIKNLQSIMFTLLGYTLYLTFTKHSTNVAGCIST